MRILVIHNFYGSEAPSGENIAVLADVDLLKADGHDVQLFAVSSDRVRKANILQLIVVALRVPWNWSIFPDLNAAVSSFKPDVVHVHNVFPLFSNSVFWYLRRFRLPVVFSIHNFRNICASGMLVRKGLKCTLCVERRSVLPGLLYRCYRSSFLATIPLSMHIALHRMLKTLSRSVSVFVVLSDFQKKEFIQAGYPVDRLFLRAQCYPGEPQCLGWERRDLDAVFVGRLSWEKGADLAVKAWAKLPHPRPSLTVVGDGPDRSRLERIIKECGVLDSVRLLGTKSFAETQNLLRRAKVVLIPSRVFEGAPMVIREAFAFGVPVLCSDIGSLPELVQDGYSGMLFDSNNLQSIATSVETFFSDFEFQQRLAAGARTDFERQYSARVGLNRLYEIYNHALEFPVG